jgi:leucyl-tRNA synthetase
MGAMFDWGARVSATGILQVDRVVLHPTVQAGLAYRKMSPVDFCPNCNTTLAREQVWGDDRHCERCGTPVIKKELEQWFFKTTKYADELLNFDGIDWPERVKTLQTNWIGPQRRRDSVIFKTEDWERHRHRRFHHPPDTLWGATFMVFSPEHPLVDKITTPEKKAGSGGVQNAGRASERHRARRWTRKRPASSPADTPSTRSTARIPIWIADYVLMTYGTGAIMAVPAHDERDFAFARKFELPIVPVIQPEGTEGRSWRGHDGSRVYRRRRHDQLRPSSTGHPSTLKRDKEPRHQCGHAEWLEEKGIGRDWRSTIVTARLADQPPALLGRADPDDLLRNPRLESGA